MAVASGYWARSLSRASGILLQICALDSSRPLVSPLGGIGLTPTHMPLRAM